jgi:hypothetical protein
VCNALENSSCLLVCVFVCLVFCGAGAVALSAEDRYYDE